MKYINSVKMDVNGKYEATTKDVFDAELGFFEVSKDLTGDAKIKALEDAKARFDTNFKQALEYFTRRKLNFKLARLEAIKEEYAKDDKHTSKDIDMIKVQIDSLQSVIDKLPPRPSSSTFANALAYCYNPVKGYGFSNSAELAAAVRECYDHKDMNTLKTVREQMLNFSKLIAPDKSECIKTRAPKVALKRGENVKKYTIEELVDACAARRGKLTKKGRALISMKDADIVRTVLIEVLVNFYGIPEDVKLVKHNDVTIIA